MSEPDQIPPGCPCGRCHHPYRAHAPEGDCTVELTISSVPSLDFGNTCPCAAFWHIPEPDKLPEPEPELLDGPRMLADALCYVRLARVASSPVIEQEMLSRAMPYFAGASAAAMAGLAADNGTGDITERRWRAALAGEAELPEDAPA